MASSGEHSTSWPDPDTDPTGGDVDGDPTEFLGALSVGTFFGDRFEVGANLGSGAMGRVVQAIDLTTGQEVALKVLHRERAKDPQSVERLSREAAILAAIGHPGIVRVIALGGAVDGTPWLAMELLRGETLKARILRGPMPAMEVLPILVTLCDALAAAHHAGVVHRDLKPENVILLESGQPPCKILDFGLSRFTASKTLTQSGTILGTPRYMAPEQIRSAANATHRVDLFAVGVLLYEMLTGRSPYPAEDMGQLLGCVIEGRTIPLAQSRPDLPAAVGAVIARAMSRTPEERFETAGAIAEAYAMALGVRSGRSHLDAAHDGAPPTAADEAGAQPLVDPFGAPPMAAPDVQRSIHGESGAHPQRPAPPQSRSASPPSPSASPQGRPATREPTPTPAQPVQRASWPGAQPDFTRPRTSRATPAPAAAKRATRSPALGCAMFVVALAIVIVLAAGVGVLARAWIDGRVSMPGVGTTLVAP